MNFQFNPAQLSRCQQNSLMDVLGVIQSENQNELEVTPVEFPLKLKVKLDGDIEMLLGWDAEKKSYAGLTTPERLEQDIKDLASERVQPESEKDTVDLPGPEPEPDLSPVVERVQVLARAYVNLIKPLSVEHRVECWIEFCRIFIKELMG